MKDAALKKLTLECVGNEHLLPFEEYLASIMSDEVAEKVLKDGRTLQGSFDVMKKEAKKRAINGCGYIPNEEGYRMIREYFEIKDATEKQNLIDVLDLL